jgi:hypothetical protein
MNKIKQYNIKETKLNLLEYAVAMIGFTIKNFYEK